MPNRPPTATAKAEELLRQLKSDDAGAPPRSVAALAALAGVSYVTMWKTVHRSKELGALHGSYRVSPHREAAASEQPAAAGLSPRARIEEQVTRDLLDGAIMRGTRLLSVKELTARYGTSPVTLRRILNNVKEQGLISPFGRHWTALSRPASRHATIVLIAYMELRGGSALPPLEREFLRACEMAGVRAQVTLQVVPLRSRIVPAMKGIELDLEAFHLPAGGNIAGYIYLVQTPEAFSATIMERLLTERKPVAILDNGVGVAAVAGKTIDPSRVRIFNASAHRRSGTDAAIYLLSKGHRHFAYVSPFHADSWSQTRYDGVARIVHKAGEGFSLSLYAVPRSIKDHYYAEEGARHCHGRRLERLFNDWRRSAPFSFKAPADIIRNTLFSEVFMDGEIRFALEPLLDAAAKNRRVTAWIVCNDRVAHMTLAYCARKGIRVPEQVAIIGFDDEIESSEWRLTSYNFNFSAAAATIVHYLLHPDAGHWQHRRIEEIKGMMVERSTG
jgi:DNA-binding LacI/PurR family transcriptional regulator